MNRLLLVFVLACDFTAPTLFCSPKNQVWAAETTATIDTVLDWPCWRGPSHNGVAAADQQPPLRWSSTENVLWKSPIPGRGHGSPIVVGDRIYLATADQESETQLMLCFGRQTGELIWQAKVHQGAFEKKGNSKSSLASSTPACDGERLFINFLHDGAIYTTALSRNGKQLWQSKITDFVTHQGFGSSPPCIGRW